MKLTSLEDLRRLRPLLRMEQASFPPAMNYYCAYCYEYRRGESPSRSLDCCGSRDQVMARVELHHDDDDDDYDDDENRAEPEACHARERSSIDRLAWLNGSKPNHTAHSCAESFPQRLTNRPNSCAAVAEHGAAWCTCDPKGPYTTHGPMISLVRRAVVLGNTISLL